ncbi:transcription-repair coupling factor [Methyloceanibacter sp.]|uniref:transcription-repair coupling factor n=1 Tax=Methyloceanibacter sp. TaxID=1965321 RepID=UPI002D6481FF|nr:transcription-repair coupling factor [Methyloceanibacter sp.]HZP09580.1 transcription-repair coupling factor [Methyloceanibacter sp.]
MSSQKLPSLPVEQLLKRSPALAGGVPEGLDALVLGELARHAREHGAVLHIARDANRLSTLEEAIALFAPDVEVLSFPAWDGVPYDRVAPNAETIAERIATLAALIDRAPEEKRPLVILTTIHAALQRVPPRAFISGSSISLHAGNAVAMQTLIDRLEASGYARSGTVVDPGQYAVRGGILDLYPPGGEPVRLDFFGDTLESIRVFQPETQRTKARREEVELLPMSELALTPEVRRHFRQRYVELFGPVTGEDPLYESISAGRQHQGMEHWLPLFHDHLETLFGYVPRAIVSLDPLVDDARARRLEQIADHYDARAQALERKAFGAPPYHPVPPESLFLNEEDWQKQLAGRNVVALDPFEHPDQAGANIVSFGGRQGRSFAAERQTEGLNVFDAVVAHAKRLHGEGKRVLVACWSAGARERLAALLAEHGGGETKAVASFAEALALPASATAVAVLPLETGFEAPGIAVIGEQDILGDRLVRKSRVKRGSDVLTEVSSLAVGDLVVHADHGIGRFAGLATIEAAGEPHDCLEVHYASGDKLYLPVENIELLSRYGSDEAGVQLDRLGGVGWQTRKARLKQRIRDMAEKLIKVAALRELRQAPVLTPPDGIYDEFSARFPYEETEDQETSIGAVLEDLASGRPMDRLICGDVGFGKTEVALRASLIAVLAGKQVAVVVPTTLLARQHYHTFTERFRGFPVKIAQASRLVAAKERADIKKGLKSGDIDIVIGTHALLGKGIEFADLGLLIVDEEQHFGVQHKERLKQLREDVHVLTLTATPIPRTLQLALSGVREMSLISTPPVDRLAVRTYVMPFDPVILREALLRERYRGGQTFYVVPRISDLDEAAAFLGEHAPELKVGRAHGQMGSRELEQVMNAFYDRQYDVLLSTSIVESGLDIPSANTLIVHRADMFGLAQLYQLRGRVGRSKIRAYAYFTVPADARLTPAAEKRLKVLQSLDTLGAGFVLASHDLDIRGAGNLLGEEQSGHIREVGYELYQSMLEEAVAAIRGGEGAVIEDQWSPRINLGTSVLIPETYVPDLQVRLGLYRRLSSVESHEAIEAFAAELIDRFGPLPQEVRHLLDVVEIKGLCRQAGIEQIDAGPKGAVIGFRNKSFANPDGLIAFIREEGKTVKLQPDHRLIYYGDWQTAEERLEGARELLKRLVKIAQAVKRAA